MNSSFFNGSNHLLKQASKTYYLLHPPGKKSNLTEQDSPLMHSTGALILDEKALIPSAVAVQQYKFCVFKRRIIELPVKTLQTKACLDLHVFPIRTNEMPVLVFTSVARVQVRFVRVVVVIKAFPVKLEFI